MSSKPNRLLNVPESNIAEVKQKPSTPPTTSPMKLTTHIGTPPRSTEHPKCTDKAQSEECGSGYERPLRGVGHAFASLLFMMVLLNLQFLAHGQAHAALAISGPRSTVKPNQSSDLSNK